jgi:glutamyl-tRNA synthetase
MSIRTRFAPSPTGYLHVGGARTALFNWLFARKHGGAFVLRIEDTDEKRNTPEALAAITDGLHWLGMDWDEGPGVGGAFGPYAQSGRKEIYERHLAALESGGHLYEDAGAIRFRSPRETVIVEDLVCGRIAFDLSNPGTHPDMTIRRPDGSFIFHFVNVVDDIEMQITHVIRGEDHLSNTPKHIELYRALGATPPQFAHIPLILNKEGRKLSKRDGGASVSFFLEEGYAPEAVVNYLCLLGWSPKDDREELAIGTIRELFDLGAVNRRNAIFDLDKCFWLNGQHLLHMAPARFLELVLPFIERAGIAYGSREALVAPLATVQPKVKHLSDVPSWIAFYFLEEVEPEPEAAEKAFAKPGARTRLSALVSAFAQVAEWTHPALEAALKATASNLGVKAGELVLPTRVAATGRTVGPGLYELLEVLGRERSLARMERACARCAA